MEKSYIDRKMMFKYSRWMLISLVVNIFFICIVVLCGMKCSSPVPLVVVKDSETDVEVEISITLFDFDDD